MGQVFNGSSPRRQKRGCDHVAPWTSKLTCWRRIVSDGFFPCADQEHTSTGQVDVLQVLAVMAGTVPCCSPGVWSNSVRLHSCGRRAA
mmetsp:Transcript_32583/g.87487  ORF Transcript_32583/g.87487 Transcript_32583/m.87487 type:complete len:88 (-) Transcript_32583:104-367(-)